MEGGAWLRAAPSQIDKYFSSVFWRQCGLDYLFVYDIFTDSLSRDLTVFTSFGLTGGPVDRSPI